MTEQHYGVSDLPLEPIEPGTVLLVNGPRRLTSTVADTLALERRGDDEGSIVVSTNTTGRNFVSECRARHSDIAPETVGFVDATGRADVDVDTEMQLRSVSSTGDLTGISIAISILHAGLSERGYRRIRSVFDSLSILLLYTNPKTITRFVHTVGGRISATDGLGVFVLDPTMHENSVVHMLQHVCDGRVHVGIENGETALRVEGLPDQPTEWVALDQ